MAEEGAIPAALTYPPPKGRPLGITPWFRFGAFVLRPLLFAIARRDWRGQENIPKSGPIICVSNHISYLDPLVFAHFLHDNGRAPRFLGKAELFRIPFIGMMLRGAGQVPIKRESPDALQAFEHAIALLKAGHLLGVYPEGTLTREPNIWPMKAKTGVARLAIMTKTKVVPCAQWGAQAVLLPYGRTISLFPRKTFHVWAGKPLDFSEWYGREDDPVAIGEATEFMMSALTSLLEQIRSESAPVVRFDSALSDHPRIGNFKKTRRQP
jgi:1-acyl-sn-glycerol-3-phosphate acyltransferase